ncbi:MAG: spore germination protein, partial [Enterocloster sp.]
MNQALHVDKNFDVVYRVLTIADKKACLYFIDGFTKDDSLLKILQGFSSIKKQMICQKMPTAFQKKYLPYGEIGLLSDGEKMMIRLLPVF